MLGELTEILKHVNLGTLGDGMASIDIVGWHTAALPFLFPPSSLRFRLS